MVTTAVEADEAPPPYTPNDPLTPTSSANDDDEGPQREPGRQAAPLYSDSVAPTNFVSAIGYFQERPPPDAPPVDGELREHALTIYTRSKAKDYKRFPRCWRSREELISKHDWKSFLNYLFPAHLGLASAQPDLPPKLRAEIQRDQKDRHQETDQERRTRIAAVVSEWNDCFFLPRGTAVIYCYGSDGRSPPVSPLCPECYPSTVRSTTYRQGPPNDAAADAPELVPTSQALARSVSVSESAPEALQPQQDIQGSTQVPISPDFTPGPTAPPPPPPPPFGLFNAVNTIQTWANTITNQAQQYGENLGKQAGAYGKSWGGRAERLGKIAEQRAQAHAEAVQRHAKRMEQMSKSYTKAGRDTYRTPWGPGWYGGGSRSWNEDDDTAFAEHCPTRNFQRRSNSAQVRPSGPLRPVSSYSSNSGDSESEYSDLDDSVSTISSDSNWDADDLQTFRNEIQGLRQRHQQSRRTLSRQQHTDTNALRHEIATLRAAHGELRAATCRPRGAARAVRQRPTREQRRAFKEEIHGVKREYKNLARQAKSEMRGIRLARKVQRKQERKARKAARKGKQKQKDVDPEPGLEGAGESNTAVNNLQTGSANVSRDEISELESGIVHINIDDNDGAGPSSANTTPTPQRQRSESAYAIPRPSFPPQPPGLHPPHPHPHPHPPHPVHPLGFEPHHPGMIRTYTDSLYEYGPGHHHGPPRGPGRRGSGRPGLLDVIHHHRFPHHHHHHHHNPHLPPPPPPPPAGISPVSPPPPPPPHPPPAASPVSSVSPAPSAPSAPPAPPAPRGFGRGRHGMRGGRGRGRGRGGWGGPWSPE